jgi:hypothetical protein
MTRKQNRIIFSENNTLNCRNANYINEHYNEAYLFPKFIIDKIKII